MPEVAKIDWSVFSWPRILFAEQVVANNARAFMLSDQLKCGRDMLIDYIAVSEDTYSINTGVANGSYLNAVNVDWWIHDRAKFSPIGPMNSQIFSNHYLATRTVNPIAGVAARTEPYLFHHPVKWLYNPLQSVTAEWLNPATKGQATGNLNTLFGIHAVGTVSGHRRVFGLPFAFATNAAGQTSGLAAATISMGNPGDQPYLVESSLWQPDDPNWAVFNDNRISNHIRMRIRPTQGDAWSDIPIPGIFYGVSQGQPNRVSWYKPPGGPILLRKNQQMVFELLNNGAGFNLNIQVALIGRVAPGYASIE
jgi:hypothetical protein